MAKAHDITTYQGKKVNQLTSQILKAANILLRTSKYGGEKENVTMTQGGYNKGGVAASAGTHDGGGVFDLTAFNIKNRVRVLRLLGVAFSDRLASEGPWPRHGHGVVINDGSASRVAQNQVTSYLNGRNGLANNGKDKGWRPVNPNIRFIFNGSKAAHYLKKNYVLKDQPYSKGKDLKTAKKGDKFTPIAWVRNTHGNAWAVDKNGNFAFEGQLTKTKPAAPKPPAPPAPKPTLKADKKTLWVTADKVPLKDGYQGKTLSTVDAGYLFNSAQTATMDGKTVGYVSSKGEWIEPGKTVAAQKVTSLHPIYRVKANPFLWGLAVPGTGNVKRGQAMDGAKLTAVDETILPNGERWVRNLQGYWWSAKYLVPESGDVDPKDETDSSLLVGTFNVIRWRMGRENVRNYSSFKPGFDYYPDRVNWIADIMRVTDVFTTTESGQYVDADRISAALGKGWANVLHGDDAGDLTMAVHWNTNRLSLLDSGKFETGPQPEVSHHGYVTWTLLRDIESDTVVLVLAHHAEYRERGKTEASKYDLLREKHTAALASGAKYLAEGFEKSYGLKQIPIIIAGDFNQDIKDFYDGPGRAMGNAGFVDTQEQVETIVGPYGTLNSLKNPTAASARRVDRIFIRHAQVRSLSTVEGFPMSDHNAVYADIVLKG